jgi:hypothetical protein
MTDLERELRALGAELLVPSGASLPARVRARIAELPAPDRGGWQTRLSVGRPSWRRAALLAAALVIALAAVAGAATLGLPGLRIVFGPAATPVAPSTAPSRTPAAASPAPSGGLGTGLGLGAPITPEAAHDFVPFGVVVPTDPRLGDLEAMWWDPTLGSGQLALLWPAGPGLPAIDDSGVGAILTQAEGHTDAGLVRKVLGQGATAEPVAVAGAPGFWISGPPHEFFYETPDGEVVPDSRRVVGDTLTWWRGGILYRLESGLGRDAAIEVAESIP